MVVLTGFLTPLALLGSLESIHKKVKAFSFFMLALESAMIGVFVSLDLFLFYVFWDFMLIPMYFLIGIWGYDRRIYAAVKFMLYTMAGSVLMLIAILGLAYLRYAATGTWSFNLLDLYGLQLPAQTAMWFFLAFTVAFAIKVPLWPFHTWLPDAHVEAPTAGSVILAGVLLKMGTYGFVRFCLPLFPAATAAATPWLLALAVIGIIYGALVAMVQPDLKKLVAYSSVSHLGFVMLGIFALNMEGMKGGLLQMINHGISTGALFLIVGMIYERRHTRLIERFGGITAVMPLFAACFMIVTLSSIGLPGTNGFVGEFLILLGAFGSHRVAAVLAASGVVLGAAYMLWIPAGHVRGRSSTRRTRGSGSERPGVCDLLPLLILIFWIGIYPKPFLDTMEASVVHVLDQAGAPVTAPAPAEGADEHSLLLNDGTRLDGRNGGRPG
jgi:NADH-quinone oxidoreductase subunit M